MTDTRPEKLIFALVVCAAIARILLQVAAMPPYAGLDEAWHVARLEFVRAEHRQPSMRERSIPSYIGAAIRGDERAMPAFGELRERWPSEVRERNRKIAFHHPAVIQPYESPNYEAQQPPLYYALAAPLGGDDALVNLQRWRLLAGLFALIVAASAAVLCHRFFGVTGLVLAALIASLPTWLTLVIRAGNDSLACAAVALGLAISASRWRGGLAALAESAVWCVAIATKLYTWPIAIAVPIFWRLEKRSRGRLALVVLSCAAVAGYTLYELAHRTNNPLGHFGFDPAAQTAQPRPIAYAEMVKIMLATLVWTSGQHADALKPVAMLAYALPLLLLMRARKSPYFAAAAGAAVAFAAAHLIGTWTFIRHAHANGLSLPVGGKEGWYWYALAPLAIGLFATRWRLAAVWLLLWDVIINECALFHDWAGTASPASPSMLFRWGPLHAPFTSNLDGIGAGPLTSLVIPLRVTHLLLLCASVVVLRSIHRRGAEVPS